MHPGDIENFAKTCRHLRLLGVDVRDEHQSLKTAHGNISLRNCWPSTVLRKYREYRSRIACYPKKITITEKDWPIYDTIDHYAVDQMRILAAEGRRNFPSANIYSLLDSSDGKKVAGILTAILLGRLPNLETIFYVDDSLYQDPKNCVDGVIDGIMELTTSPVGPSIFPRLSHLSITKVDEWTFPRGFEPFLRLLTLPTLRSFEVSEYRCQEFDTLPFHPRTSRVERLDISLLVYSSKSMLTLLNAFEALKSFKLRIVQGRLGQVQRFLPAVHACLLENFQSSLQWLEIDDGNPNPEFFGSLRPFNVLKSVVIQPVLLMSADHNVMPRLVDGFPRSIEEIKFTRGLTETQKTQLFAGFLDRLDATVPNLRLIISCQFSNWRHTEKSQPGGEYRFRYISYRDDTVTVQYIDTSSATSQWRDFQLPIEDLKRKRD